MVKFIFLLETALKQGLAPITTCLRYFQKMYVLDLEFKREDEVFRLESLKKMVIQNIRSNHRKWQALGPFELIEGWINEKKSIKDLILLLE